MTLNIWQTRINELRAVGQLLMWEHKIAELRFNKWHDPTNGRFCSADGVGGGSGKILSSKELTDDEKDDKINDREFNPLPADKVVNTLRKESDKWLNKINYEEERSIKKYTQNSGDADDNKFFDRLNTALRENDTSDKKLMYYSEQISNGIGKFSLEHDIVCYRRIESNYYADLSVGAKIKQKQFISTSVTKKGTLKNEVLLEINVPKGAKGAYVEKISKYPNQREFLIDKGSTFRILEKKNNYVKLEVII